VGTMAFTAYNWWENSSLKKDLELLQIALKAVQEARSDEAKKSVIHAEIRQKQDEELKDIFENLKTLQDRATAVEKKANGISRVKGKLTSMEKSVSMTIEACGNQITGLSDQLSAMEEVYRHSIDNLEENLGEIRKVVDHMDRKVQGVEQQQQLYLLLKGSKDHPTLTALASSLKEIDGDGNNESEDEEDGESVSSDQ